MPYLGPSSFLLLLHLSIPTTSSCVNALPRAFLISTDAKPAVGKSYNWCQCPTSGLPHFYEEVLEKLKDKPLCQCPTSGLPHFYNPTCCNDYCRKRCVSMPYLGPSSFLQLPEGAQYRKVIVCQCPTSGLPHFYEMVKLSSSMSKLRVNALPRAFLISTLCPGNPHKHGAPGLIFAGNSQNILKTTVFRYFLCLFIV